MKALRTPVFFFFYSDFHLLRKSGRQAVLTSGRIDS